jgi:hypothetical protein
LHVALSICLKLQNEYNYCSAFDVWVVLCRTWNFVCSNGSWSYLCFTIVFYLHDKFDASMAHNMLALMLDPRFKTLKCVTNLIGKDKAQVIMNEYDSKI